MDIPTAEDINIYDSLDEQRAAEHFLGKTLDEAEALFREDSAHYQEDLMWMGPRAFAFYLPAATQYLQSDSAAGDDHMIYCLLNIIEFRMEQPEFPLAREAVADLTAYVIDHYDKFEVFADVYGDLRGKYRALQQRLAMV